MSSDSSSQWEYTVFVPLVTANRQRRMHYHEWGPLSAEARASSHILALQAKIPRMKRARVSFFPGQAKGRLADPAAHAPTCKALLDGLVDAKLLEDDSGEYIERLCFYAPVRAEKDQVRIVIVPLDI